jgi:ABC-type multidrug transport system permease subunit
MPVRITRWQTLLAKWAMAVVIPPVLTALLLLVAIGLLHMDASHVVLLWVFLSFGAVVIAMGTLVLFAALGSLGQLVAILVFVYLALASSGGTVPLEALPGILKFAANFEPLRQILDGTRSILYFNASGAAGLTRGFLLTGVGLVLWLVVGIAVTTWYDRKGLYRMEPDVLEYMNRSAAAYAAGTHDPPAAG